SKWPAPTKSGPSCPSSPERKWRGGCRRRPLGAASPRGTGARARGGPPGTVQEAAPGGRLSPGDRVMARVSPAGLVRGGYAEYTQARPEDTVRLPDATPFAEAAAFFINY